MSDCDSIFALGTLVDRPSSLAALIALGMILIESGIIGAIFWFLTSFETYFLCWESGSWKVLSIWHIQLHWPLRKSFSRRKVCRVAAPLFQPKALEPIPLSVRVQLVFFSPLLRQQPIDAVFPLDRSAYRAKVAALSIASWPFIY